MVVLQSDEDSCAILRKFDRCLCALEPQPIMAEVEREVEGFEQLDSGIDPVLVGTTFERAEVGRHLVEAHPADGDLRKCHSPVLMESADTAAETDRVRQLRKLRCLLEIFR